jgi:hypothetical protein
MINEDMLVFHCRSGYFSSGLVNSGYIRFGIFTPY